MDLILLPPDPTAPDKTQDTSALVASVSRLLTWLLERRAPIDLFSFLPQDAALAAHNNALERFARLGHVRVHALEAAQAVSAQRLAKLNHRILKRMIFTLRAGEVDPGQLTETLTAFQRDRPRVGFKPHLWFYPGSGTDHFQTLQRLETAGFTGKALSTPLFHPISPGDAFAKTNALETVDAPSPCRLYDNSISLTPNGEIRACPRHHGTTIDLDLGQILEMDPEDLIEHRGRFRHRVLSSPLCAGCAMNGRFSWPIKSGAAIRDLFAKGEAADHQPTPQLEHVDPTALGDRERRAALSAFAQRLTRYRDGRIGLTSAHIAIEVPVFKGAALIPCIESVLQQTDPRWTLTLLWDGGDDTSAQILRLLDATGIPGVRIFYQPNQGIAKARRFLTQQTLEPWILPLDDDDLLTPEAVAQFIAATERAPWSGIIRAQRRFIDATGRPVEQDDWFPHEPRRYHLGMTCDLHNHAQPALMRRDIYNRTQGWRGFEAFKFAGEDCDIFTQIEDTAPITLLDRPLYHYRLHPGRTSLELGAEAAYDMWRRLADDTISRRGLPLTRINDRPPFQYQPHPQPPAALDQIEFVIPFWESNERELTVDFSRPNTDRSASLFTLSEGAVYSQPLPPDLDDFDRLEIGCTAARPVKGRLTVSISHTDHPDQPISTQTLDVDRALPHLAFLSVSLETPTPSRHNGLILRIGFQALARSGEPLHLTLFAAPEEEPMLLLRLFRHDKGCGRRLLNRCIASLVALGIEEDAVHVVAKQQSAAANRNEGFARTHKPLVCFLDDDVVLSDTAVLTDLMEAMDQMDAQLAGPKIIDAAGRIFCAEPYFQTGMVPAPRGLGDVDDGRYNGRTTVTWLPTTLLLIRREVFTAIGGFDEGYVGSQVEDVDFCVAARQRGFHCVYVGSVAITHFNQQRNYQMSQNFQRFLDKWRLFPECFEEPARTIETQAAQAAP